MFAVKFLRKTVLVIMMVSLMLSPLAMSGCTDGGAGSATDPITDPATDPATEPPADGPYIYDRVVIIGVDGAGAFFEKTDTPRCDAIFENGSVTYDMLTSEPTISAECWGSLLHGVTPEFHRLTNSIVGSTAYKADSAYPSIFRVVREKYPDAELASFCNWNPINIGIVEEGLDVHKDSGSDAPLTDKITAYLGNHDPKLLFVQFDEVDAAGHANGYGKDAHLQAITAADALIGKIYDAYNTAGRLDSTLFIVTADHGGTPQGSHGGSSRAERYVYFAAAGATVADDEPVEIEIRDLAAIAAYALGVDIPEKWTAHIPGGVFEGVEATDRNVVELVRSAHRRHEMTPTPAIDGGAFLTDLLDASKVEAVFTFDGDIKDVTGKQNSKQIGKLYFVDGYNGSAVQLEDGNVVLTDYAPGMGSFSVAMWMKTDGTGDDPVLCSNKNWVSGTNSGFVLSLRAGDIKFNLGDGSNRMDEVYPLPTDYADGWVHVMLTVNRDTEKVTFYYDFEKLTEASISDPLVGKTFDALEFNIGSDGTGAYSYKLPATIDDFILYGAVFTDSEIAALANYYGVISE